jgi:hypothetical protein
VHDDAECSSSSSCWSAASYGEELSDTSCSVVLDGAEWSSVSSSAGDEQEWSFETGFDAVPYVPEVAEPHVDKATALQSLWMRCVAGVIVDAVAACELLTGQQRATVDESDLQELRVIATRVLATCAGVKSSFVEWVAEVQAVAEEGVAAYPTGHLAAFFADVANVAKYVTPKFDAAARRILREASPSTATSTLAVLAPTLTKLCASFPCALVTFADLVACMQVAHGFMDTVANVMDVHVSVSQCGALAHMSAPALLANVDQLRAAPSVEVVVTLDLARGTETRQLVQCTAYRTHFTADSLLPALLHRYAVHSLLKHDEAYCGIVDRCSAILQRARPCKPAAATQSEPTENVPDLKLQVSWKTCMSGLPCKQVTSEDRLCGHSVLSRAVWDDPKVAAGLNHALTMEIVQVVEDCLGDLP